MVWEMDGFEFLADMCIVAEDSKQAKGPILKQEAVQNMGLLMEQLNGSKRNPPGNLKG